MKVYKFTTFLNESKKEKRKYNNLIKKLGVLNNGGNINLNDMTEKINQFLSKDGNKDKFLKDYDDNVKPNIEVSKEKIKVKDIKPSQNEIFLDHVLSRMVNNKKEREEIINGKFKDNDILISSDYHIIDGHHRWALAFILNPECELNCTEIKIPIKYALPIINAMLEVSDIENNDKKTDYSINIFDTKYWGKKKLLKKINSIISKNIELKTNESLYNINTSLTKSFYKKIKKGLNLEKHPLKYMRKNLRKISKPSILFSGRDDMPQLNKKDAKEIL